MSNGITDAGLFNKTCMKNTILFLLLDFLITSWFYWGFIKILKLNIDADA